MFAFYYSFSILWTETRSTGGNHHLSGADDTKKKGRNLFICSAPFRLLVGPADWCDIIQYLPVRSLIYVKVFKNSCQLWLVLKK